MANNLFANIPAVCVAKTDISFAAAGITSLNTRIIYKVGNPLLSYIPGRVINAISGFEENEGYYIVPAVDMDLTAVLVPPLDSIIIPAANNLLPQNIPGSEDYNATKAATFIAASEQALVCHTNDRLRINPTNGYSASVNSLTLMGWVKFSSVPTLPMVIACKDDNATQAGSEYYMGYYPLYNGFVFQIESAAFTTRPAVFPILPEVDKWYFVCGWYDHVAKTTNIQVDNQHIYTLSFAENTSNGTDTPFTVGGVGSASGDMAECCSYMDGALKSIGLFKRTLSQSQRDYFFNGGSPGGNPGTLSGTYSHDADVPAAISANVRSVNFNGGFYDFTKAAIMYETGSSISLWIKPGAFNGVLIGHSGSSSAYIKIQDDHTIRVQTNDASTFKDYAVPTITVNTWHHLAVVRGADGNTRVYWDNVESTDGPQDQAGHLLTLNQVAKYWDGAHGLGYMGKLAELQYFDYALTTGDIANLSSGSSATTSPLIRHKMDESAGSSIVDYGTNKQGAALEYAELSDTYKNESYNTFISYWDLKEVSGNRADSRGI